MQNNQSKNGQPVSVGSTNGSAIPVLIVPVGLIAKIKSAANGFRTKREVADMFAAQGLTYEMMRDMAEGAVKTEERKVKTCRYAPLLNIAVSQPGGQS